MHAFAYLTVALLAVSDGKPTPPAQPKSGPGGSDYAHSKIIETTRGEGDDQYWVYEPAEPAPAKAPLVIFLHGYGAMDPRPYRLWIEHIAKKGSIVIYPRYQGSLLTLPTGYHPNSAKAVREALKLLDENGHVKPDVDRVAIVGHSAGGVGAATWAARAVAEKLPVPKAVMVVEPGQGRVAADGTGMKLIPLDDYAKISVDAQMLVIVGSEDTVVRDGCAKEIYQAASQVRRKSYILMHTDTHGSPPLRATHFAPLATEPIKSTQFPNGRRTTDALDYYGFWKLFDGLCDAAFAGKEYAVDKYMGKWSDGTPVKELELISR